MKKNLKFLRPASTRNFYKLMLFVCLINIELFQDVHAQGTTNIITIPAAYLSSGFKGTGNFNALIFGNLESSGGDTEGRLAIKGNFVFPNGGYSVGAGSIGPKAPDNTDNFIVNGNFANGTNNWGLIGNFVYNTKSPTSALPSLNSQGATITSGKVDHIIFSTDLLTKYRTISTNLDALPNTGVVTHVNSWDPYLLKGLNSGLNVFDLTLPSTFSGGVINIDIPDGATAVINVSNTSLTLSGGSLKIKDSDDKTKGAKVLFNFPKATSISLSSYAFIGSFLAPYADLTGSGGSINGQAVIGGNVGQSSGFEFHNIYFTGSFDSPLPVTLIQFNAISEVNTVALNWSTSSETNSSRFDIERSQNGKIWNQIGTVDAMGESNQAKNYFFSDNAPAQGENLYRLKMVDRDETFAYSRIQSVKVENSDALAIFPNPVTDRILLKDISNVNQVTLLDPSGRKVYQTEKIQSTGIDCKDFVAGNYIVMVARTNGTVSSHHILIRK